MGIAMRGAVIITALGVLWGCAAPQPVQESVLNPPPAREATVRPEPVRQPEEPPKKGFRVRTVTDEELWEQSKRDPELSPTQCRMILARLNTKAHYLISEDMENKRPLKVPNDFRAYKDWSPLPRHLPSAAGAPKLILVVLDIPFIGWYENGKLVGDTYICIGIDGQETRPGTYPILEKDDNHFSRSYSNSYGEPAWMPWAMRIYEAVWIHAGDITGAQCSHGCVTLPLKEAEELFKWAGPETTVRVVDSLQKG